MSEISRPVLLVYAAAAIAVVFLGARWLGEGGGAAPGTVAGRPGGPPAGERVRLGAGGGGPVVVHVAGAVRRPGVYRLRAGARVVDAVGRAGGATSRANENGVDLAAKLADGVQVVVPVRGPAAAGAAAGAGGAAGGTSGAGASGGAGPAAGASAPAGPLSLSSATAEQLDGLDGVGPTTAQKIVAYRVAHGGFGSVDELDRIPGIGAKKLAALRPQVSP